MTSTQKKVAIGCGVLSLLAVIGACAMFFLMKGAMEDLVATGQETVADAQAFGRGRGSSECIDEAFARHGRCDGIMCQATVGAWLSQCLEVSDRDPALCVGVPPESEIMRSVEWRQSYCTDRGATDVQACGNLIAGIQRVCHPPGS
ncbi:MAG: hypothetical protein AB7S26_20880 [Sandaracinaceae bacterium]